VFGPATDGGECARPQRRPGRVPAAVSSQFPPEVAVLPTADGPKVRAGQCGTSVPTVGGRLLRLEIGHRSNLSVLVMDARPLHPYRPDRGVRHRARGCARTLQVGGFSGCGHLQLCHLRIGGFLRSAQQEVADEFDRLFER